MNEHINASIIIIYEDLQDLYLLEYKNVSTTFSTTLAQVQPDVCCKNI